VTSRRRRLLRRSLGLLVVTGAALGPTALVAAPSGTAAGAFVVCPEPQQGCGQTNHNQVRL